MWGETPGLRNIPTIYNSAVKSCVRIEDDHILQISVRTLYSLLAYFLIQGEP